MTARANKVIAFGLKQSTKPSDRDSANKDTNIKEEGK